MKLDLYNFHARLRPALLVLAPAALAAVAWFPGRLSIWAPVTTVAVYFGVTYLLAQLGRDLGKQKELPLFASWGGSPTTQQLRHSRTRLDWITLSRCHKFLGNATGVTAPTAKEESEDQIGADQVYAAYTFYLREMTRDREKYPLVFAENVNYGFRRNLWAMKPAAILLAVDGLIASATAVAMNDAESSLNLRAGAVIGCVVLLVWWTLRITPSWVRLAADSYADRLLGAGIVLAEPTRDMGKK